MEFETLENEKNSISKRRDELERAWKKASQEALAAGDEALKLSERLSDEQLKTKTLTAKASEQHEEMTRQERIITIYKENFPTFEVTRWKLVAPPIDARVEGVIMKEGIVILSVGAEDNVKKGYTFYVYRDNSYIGQLEVDEVYPSKCSARINREMTPRTIRSGDGAKTRLRSF